MWRKTSVYAVIEAGGKQHKVTEGEILHVEKIDAEIGAEVKFDKVAIAEAGAMV